MLRNPTPNDLKSALAADPDTLGGFVWRHKKRGGLYRIETLALRESDLSPEVVYRSEDGTALTRPAAEFFDGRFSPVLAPRVLRIPAEDTVTADRLREKLACVVTPPATTREVEQIREQATGKTLTLADARYTLMAEQLRAKLFAAETARKTAERERDEALARLFDNGCAAIWSAAATEAIATERTRQIIFEGFTSKHDDNHRNGALYRAAQAYFFQACGFHEAARWRWPWDTAWWKPTTPARDLEKAGALVFAERDRLRRAGLPDTHVEALRARIVAELAATLAKQAPASGKPSPIDDFAALERAAERGEG